MEKVKNALLGIAIGDALGVPVEFKSREYLEQHPITGMTGNGTYNQPPGTWSDDSSLTFCLAEAITEGYSLERTARKFIRWRNEGYWGAHHRVFDIGATTNIAISRLEYILAEEDKFIAYKKSVDDIRKLWEAIQFPVSERKHFKRVIAEDISVVHKSQIRSGGYVIDSLEASLWCFLRFESFRDAVLSAVDLGHDTDTTAAITGGLASIYHGVEGIPEEWLASLAMREEIVKLGKKLAKKTGL